MGSDIHGSVHRKCIFKSNQQDATLHNVLISVKCSACFRRVLAHHQELETVYMASGTCQAWLLLVAVKPVKYPILCTQFWAPDDGRRTRLKHVEHFTEINTLCNVASCGLDLKIKGNRFGIIYPKFLEHRYFLVKRFLHNFEHRA
jgi:hypothetical protein